jgi:hypothetical protein
VVRVVPRHALEYDVTLKVPAGRSVTITHVEWTLAHYIRDHTEVSAEIWEGHVVAVMANGRAEKAGVPQDLVEVGLLGPFFLLCVSALCGVGLTLLVGEKDTAAAGLLGTGRGALLGLVLWVLCRFMIMDVDPRTAYFAMSVALLPFGMALWRMLRTFRAEEKMSTVPGRIGGRQ